MPIILTGFEPFGDVQVNPSEQIVRTLADRYPDELVATILPTVFAEAERQILELIERVRPEAVVSLGVAAGRPAITLERVALNLDDTDQPDNSGMVAAGQPIAADGPLAYWSTLPLEAMRDSVAGLGIPVRISNHAGTYVCNHVFFAARHAIESRGLQIPCGFIHVPALTQPGVTLPYPSMELEPMISGIEQCLQVLRDSLAPAGH
ncbi:MAG TPA: pyroglutamyl-peptidase I [Herpetosiphonaceae bacterium]